MSSDDEAAALNARLLEQRERLRSTGAMPELRAGAGVPLLPGGNAMEAALAGLRPMEPKLERADIYSRRMAALAKAIDEMRRRCAGRLIDPCGEICAAMMNWDGRAGWDQTLVAMATGASVILVTGDKGSGKSCIAGRIVAERRVVGAGTLPMFVSAARLAQALARPPDEPAKALKRWAELAPVIAIDDFGRVPMPPENLEALREYMATRVPLRRLSVFTSNLEPMVFMATILDERLSDRLKGRMEIVQLSGGSRRGVA